MRGEPASVQAMVRGEAAADLDERSRRLLAFALKLTRVPRAVREDDLAGLSGVGLTDAGIHDAASVTAYFNFVNRIALGLGVELEAGSPDGTPPDDPRSEGR